VGEPVLRGAFGLALLLLGSAAPAQTAAAPAAPLATPPPAAPEPAPVAEGPIVTAVEIRSDAPLDLEENLPDLLSVRVGEPLTEDAIRHTLRDFQASGRSSEVAFYTRDEAGGGVVAIVALQPVVRAEDVRLVGQLGLSESDLRRALPQERGEALSEEKVLRGVRNLEESYRRQGYFHPSVLVRVTTDDVRRLAVVTYQVASGPRATVSAIAFDGPIAPFEPATLIRQLKLHPGESYRHRAAEEDADRLQQWLFKQQHTAARVDSPRADYDPAANRVRLVFPIDVGPRIVVAVVGADLKKLESKGLLPFRGEVGYDEALVLQAVGRIKAYYQGQGYYHVRVESHEDKSNGELQLTIAIDPGAQYAVEGVRFDGNQAITTAQLAQLMKTSARSLFRPGSGRLVQEELDADLENVRSFYALQGYSRVKVGPARVEESGRSLRVVIPIVEGPQQRVVDLQVTGVHAFDAGKLLKDLPLHSGGPFHPVLLDDTLRAIRQAYDDKGYSQAQVSVRSEWNPDSTLVDLTIEVLEGPQQVVDHVIVRGNQRTKSDVIRRTLHVRQGEPVSDSRRREMERDLYRLGIFSRVDVTLTRAGGLEDAERDVLVKVEEGKAHSVTYGLGYDSEDGVRGSLGFTDSNVAGLADSLRTELRLSRPDTRLRVLFDQPYLWNFPVSLTSSLFYESEAFRDKPYDATRYGARTEAVRVYGSRRLSLGLDYRTVELKIDPGTALIQVDRSNQPYQLTSLVPSFYWDRRNDPVSPSRGWSTLLQMQYAFPAFTSDAEFLKVFAQQTQFFQLDRKGQSVIAASLRLGGIQPFRNLARPDPFLPNTLPNSNVFIDERFFAGGSNTHRGYDRDELGIRGQTLIQPRGETSFVPVGGNGLFLFNLEYRFPIVDSVGGTVFTDNGNVWADWRRIDVRELKTGAGLGVRYLSPIGPLRLEVGWPLNPGPGESRKPVYSFGFGNAF
jgi:outer membrane protein insertion porin family